jgi:exodeoxyribonuclease-1
MDLKHHPENYINLSYDQLKAELKKSPKILRTVRNNKFAVLMNGNYAKTLEGYKQIGIEKLIERANMIAANKDFKERVSQILLEEAENSLLIIKFLFKKKKKIQNINFLRMLGFPANLN